MAKGLALLSLVCLLMGSAPAHAGAARAHRGDAGWSTDRAITGGHLWVGHPPLRQAEAEPQGDDNGGNH